MKDQSKKLVPQGYRPSQFRLLRTAWGGTLAAVAASGLLFTAAAGAPAPRPPDHGPGLPISLHGQRENPPVRPAGTVARSVSLDQVEAVLERAKQQAREQGPDFSPTTAQAAAELGMLYTTYRMQQLALRAGAPGTDDGGPAAVAPAMLVSHEPASSGRTDAAGVDVDADNTIEAELHRVTFGQLVVAAERLANLLDSALPDALVEVQRPDRHEDHPARRGPALPGLPDATGHQGFSLRQNLLDVVTMFGGSTLGYANGRIPADVLCPLDFAPGHMLRCDAAERLTALSDAFEREFGYPIPITDSYRPYVQQVVLASTKPHLAAVPGTSNHGWGLAVDLSDPIAGGASREYAWLRVHGPDYGWDNPSWARPDGSKPEPWHFEFFAAGPVPDRAVDPSDVGAWDAAGVVSASNGANPGHEHGPEQKPKDDAPDADRSEPAARPADEPTKKPDPDDQPQRPGKPSPKPDPKPEPKPEPKPTPSEPRPKPPATSPAPSPSPSPEPSPEPSEPGHEPSNPPSPTPSEPGPTPTPSPAQPSSGPTPSPTPAPSEDGGAPAAPTPSPDPSPDPSEAAGPVSRIAKELGLVEDARD